MPELSPFNILLEVLIEFVLVRNTFDLWANNTIINLVQFNFDWNISYYVIIEYEKLKQPLHRSLWDTSIYWKSFWKVVFVNDILLLDSWVGWYQVIDWVLLGTIKLRVEDTCFAEIYKNCVCLVTIINYHYKIMNGFN